LTEIAKKVAAVTPVSEMPPPADGTPFNFEIYAAGDPDSKI
jgi:hypothetical protein